MVEVHLDKKEKGPEFDIKDFLYALVSTAALAFVIFIVMWIINYLNAGLQMPVLTNIYSFLYNEWPKLVGFVLLISIWDYIYPLFKKKLKYAKPLVDSVIYIFGLWLVAVFLMGLTAFVEASNPVVPFLNFVSKLFFEQFVLVFGAVIFINYAMFLKKEKDAKDARRED